MIIRILPAPARSRRRTVEYVSTLVDTRAGREPVAVVSLEDYQPLKETAHLLRSPANARRLLASIEELENGGGTVREPADPE